MPTLKEIFLKRLSSLEQTLREQCTYWQNMDFGHQKHDVQQFAYDLKVLGNMREMSDEQIPENFKEAFPPKY